MKVRVALAGLCAVAATSSLISMEEKGQGHSSFLVNCDKKIIGYAEQKNNFLVNMSIQCMFSRNKKDSHSLQLGFERASGAVPEVSEIVKVPCVLEKKHLVAKIIALQTLAEDKYRFKDSYFVKIQETADVGLSYIKDLCPTDYTNVFVNNNKRCLNFVVNNEKCITGYSRQNMEFSIKPSVFIGRNIIDILPLDEKDEDDIAVGFSTAAEENRTVKVPYELGEMDFVAKITALKTAEDNVLNYFVQVQEDQGLLFFF